MPVPLNSPARVCLYLPSHLRPWDSAICRYLLFFFKTKSQLSFFWFFTLNPCTTPPILIFSEKEAYSVASCPTTSAFRLWALRHWVLQRSVLGHWTLGLLPRLCFREGKISFWPKMELATSASHPTYNTYSNDQDKKQNNRYTECRIGLDGGFTHELAW